MKKVLAFALILAIALGGILFAHHSVAADQEGLVFYPIEEVGDPQILNGVTVTTGYTSQDHLHWNTSHTFGGDTVTEFSYSREPIEIPTRIRNETYIYLDAKRSYVARCDCPDRIPQPGSEEKFFILEPSMLYEDAFTECYSDSSNPISDFAFPYLGSSLPDGEKSGRIGSDRLALSEGRTLDFFHHMDNEGVWFVMDYRDQDGAVHYESPSGHGIYFFPWAETDRYGFYDKKDVVPDGENLCRCVPLNAELNIEAMGIDPQTDTACLVTLEDGMYVMHIYHLSDGQERARLELVPQDPNKPAAHPVIRIASGLVLADIQDQLILTDITGEKLLFTAPNTTNEHFSIHDFEPRTGDIHLNDETLSVVAPTEDEAFRIAAWTKDGLKYYGVYNCSILSSTESIRHNHIPIYKTGITIP